MDTQFWTVFVDTFAGTALLVCTSALVLLTAMAGLVRTLSVPGTRRRFLAASIQRTLLLPTIALLTIKCAIYTGSGSWLLAMVNLFVLLSFIYDWHRDNDDNWWSGRGRKIGSWFRRALTRSAPVSAAPSGAR